MVSNRFRQITFGLIAAPLTLGLAACGSKDEAAPAPTSGEAVTKIAPPAGKAWGDVVAKTEEGGYRLGNPDAPIKLIEYGALSCSHCADFAKASFDPLRENYIASGRVSYEMRYFMLNPYDIAASLLTTCGATEAVIPLSKQFWAWQPTMFQNLQAAGDAKLTAIQSMPKDKQLAAIADAAGMTDFFASRGIARDQAAACLADTGKAKAFADQTQKASDQFNITGTPSFILNGSPIGSMAWPEIEAKLKEAGAR